MYGLSTIHPMSKITQSAISLKWIDQKTTKLSSEFRIPIATETRELF